MRHPPDHPPGRPADRVDAWFVSVRDTDPDVLDADELDEFITRVAELRAWCDARQVRATRRQRALASEGRAAEPRSSLTNHGRTSGKDAATADQREQVCADLPGFEDALADGTIAAGHVDAIAAATKGLDDAERAELYGEADTLLGDAAAQSVDAFTKNCRDLARSIRARQNAGSDVDELERQRSQSKITRWVDQTTGMHKTLIEADPVTDRQLWAAIQHSRGVLRRRNQESSTRVSWDRLTVDALLHAISGERPNSGAGGVVVHIDLDTLTDGIHDRSLCETDSGLPVPVDVVRRMACDTAIIPVVLDGHGVVLDEGRSKRLATPEQRIALSAMQATCSHPDCTVTIDDCRIHHTTPWRLGGTTDLSDLAPVCEPHHHLIHEGGWTLTVDPDRTATWTRPDGTVSWTGTLNNRQPTAA